MERAGAALRQLRSSCTGRSKWPRSSAWACSSPCRSVYRPNPFTQTASAGGPCPPDPARSASGGKGGGSAFWWPAPRLIVCGEETPLRRQQELTAVPNPRRGNGLDTMLQTGVASDKSPAVPRELEVTTLRFEPLEGADAIFLAGAIFSEVFYTPVRRF